MAALRDVAHDAQQGAEEDGREDKTNVTTKRCCTAAAETAREAATLACCSGRGKAALRRLCDSCSVLWRKGKHTLSTTF